MIKPIIIISCVLLLVSLSCQFLFPKNTPQPQKTQEPAQEATVPAAQTVPAQPEPTQEQSTAQTAPLSTATLSPSPETLVLLEDMTLMFWNARVSYNPAVWQPGGTEAPPSLTHRQLSTCRLYEQGPTEPPQADREVTLGPVTYMVAEMESQGNLIHWYMAVKGPQGAFADGIPTLVLSSSPEELEQCRGSAEEVLASMR